MPLLHEHDYVREKRNIMTANHQNNAMQKASDTSKSVHLSASAGSGKTRALKDRYLALLDVLESRGLGIDQAVAITFTDKAAAEIKERVMRDLPEAMLKKIIRGMQDLRISTIHSFCMNLLKRYPLEAGLPPDFGVLDARDQAYKIQKAIEDALDEADRDPGLMAPLREFAAGDLIFAVEFLLSIRGKLKRMEIDAGGPGKMLQAIGTGMGLDAAESTLSALIEGPEWKDVFTRMALLLRSQGDYYGEFNGPAHDSLSAAKDAPEAYRAALALAPLYFTQKAEPRKRPCIAKGKYRANKTFPFTEYEALYTRAQEALARFLSEYRRALAGHEAASLLRIFQLAEAKYRDSKLREGLLDFDDLEIYAYRLLRGRESPDILYWLDRKILHFLVDEFQDTSDIQWAILNKLTEEIFAGQGADKPVQPTLFVVGDAKQSIYRFREANYRLIEGVRERMETNIPAGSREVLTLDKNFRSTAEVIETANQVFRALWGEAYEMSEAVRKDHKGSVRLIELSPEAPDGKAAGPTEAETLARELRFMVDAGVLVYEKTPDSGSTLNHGREWFERPAGYGDCAILIQSRTRLKEYEAALQVEGIPYRVIGGIGFYEEDEIQAMMNILFFLWNRDDKLALAAALKSPLFGLTDKELFDLTQDSDNMVEALKSRRPGDWDLLQEWAGLAGLVPLAGLLHRIIQTTGAYICFGRRNPQAIFNIDKLLDTAREFDRRGYTTLQDFVEWVKNLRETEQREATANMNLPGHQGAVSIMTVHKAKGLEFPVVFLPGMNQRPKSVTTGPVAILEDTKAGVRMAVRDAANPVYHEMWQREQEELRREHQRLLYVAMTRARDRLVMIGALAGNGRPVKENTWLDCLHAAAPRPLFESPVELPDGTRTYTHSSATEAASPDSSVERRGRPSPFQGASGGDASSEASMDVSRIISNLSPVPPSKAPEWKRATDYLEQGTSLDLLLPEPQPGAVSPLARGSVLHRCLEEHAKSGSYDLAGVLAEYPDILGLGAETVQRFADGAKTVLNAVLAHEDFAWIFERAPGSYAELPFLYKRENTLVSGVIDRLVIMGSRGYVIDYKAILIETDEALKAWNSHYRPQIQIYCEAVKHLFGVRSVEGFLLYLDSKRLERILEV